MWPPPGPQKALETIPDHTNTLQEFMPSPLNKVDLLDLAHNGLRFRAFASESVVGGVFSPPLWGWELGEDPELERGWGRSLGAG